MIGNASPAGPIGVLVVDDSPVQRRLLRAILEAEGDLEVVGEARTGSEAVSLVERLRPAVVLMDLDLPLMNGLEAIEAIMASLPTSIVVHSALVEGSANANEAAAMAAGAVDVVAKPTAYDSDRLEEYATDLRRRLRVASRVRVITHPRGRLKSTSLAGGPVPAQNQTPETRRTGRAARPGVGCPIELIAIGVSTGGPQALSLLLSSLPAGLEQAVLVVQHMADGFLEGLAQWLDSTCALPVRVGEGGRRLQPGTVTLAPGGLNLIVHERLRLTCEVPPPSQFHLPGIDPTFTSIAHHIGPAAIGVILTGMGRDGAAGLKEMRDCGAATVAQDEASSAVYGMPAAAKALGAVEHERPLVEIAPLLLTLVDTPSLRVAR